MVKPDVGSRRRLNLCVIACALAIAAWPALLTSQRPPNVDELDSALFREMSWRNAGPVRGGVTLAATGAAGQPSTFYIGVAGGGIWTTNDYGGTWRPIFDDQPAGSIGAIAVAPSNPNVIYAGSGGDLSHSAAAIGDGLYKSIDAGRTWMRLGLRDSQQISKIVVDPRDPTRLLVAVSGHPYGPNEERGIFRSTDGGQSFTKVLYRDADTGGSDVVLDPSGADTVYAVLRQTRLAPWDGEHFSGPGSGIFKSTDGGTTWQPIARGLPTYAADVVDRMLFAVAPSNPQRLFASVAARSRGGIYRSDDGGATWTAVNSDARLAEGHDLTVDPANPDVVYVAGAGVSKSTDGGRTFTAWRPAGERYRRLWIQRSDRNAMVLAGDRGAAITVNGGETWSTTSNQPTAPFTNAGMTDPLDADITYIGEVTRYDRRTGQAQNVRPSVDERTRVSRFAPLALSPAEPRALYFGANVLWKSLNGGQSWTAISPDQGRETWEVPASVGVYRGSPSAAPIKRGAIAAIAPSSLDANLVWTGTNDGLISMTRDGGRTWSDITPPALAPWAGVAGLEASHFDVGSAYASVDGSRIDDRRPYIYRTRNGGRTWTLITSGLPGGSPIHAIREDRLRRGLLFAGSDRGVHVSFDDGDRWQPLRLNLPASPVRGLAVSDDNIVAATDGRGFWILDDITALRQITPDIARASAYLFRPGSAWRHRPSAAVLPDQPGVPGQPEGVVISYLLGPDFSGGVALEILESGTGTVFRRFSSDDAAAPIPSTPGLHRVRWDVRFAPPRGAPAGTPGIVVLPGTYQVRLSITDRVYRQAVLVKTDPRVRTSLADLTHQFNLSKSLQDGMRDLTDAQRALDDRRAALANAAGRAFSIGAELQRTASPLLAIFLDVQQADAKPTAAQQAAAEDALRAAEAALASFRTLIDGVPGS